MHLKYIDKKVAMGQNITKVRYQYLIIGLHSKLATGLN